MTALPNTDAWMETCLITISKLGDAKNYQFAGLTETTDFDLGEKDIEGVPLVNGGRVTKWMPEGDSTITFEAYPLEAGTTSDAADNAYVWNNIIYGFTPRYGIWQHQSCLTWCYNNTVLNCSVGIRNSAGATGSIVAINNIVQDCNTSFTGTSATSNYNLSDTGTATGGINDVTGVTINFANPSDVDYHLSSVDIEAIGAGFDLSDDAVIPFNTDIDGDTRHEDSG